MRLFYWIRLAYRNEPNLDYEHINIAHGLSLFNLTQYELVRAALPSVVVVAVLSSSAL